MVSNLKVIYILSPLTTGPAPIRQNFVISCENLNMDPCPIRYMSFKQKSPKYCKEATNTYYVLYSWEHLPIFPEGHTGFTGFIILSFLTVSSCCAVENQWRRQPGTRMGQVRTPIRWSVAAEVFYFAKSRQDRSLASLTPYGATGNYTETRVNYVTQPCVVFLIHTWRELSAGKFE